MKSTARPRTIARHRGRDQPSPGRGYGPAGALVTLGCSLLMFFIFSLCPAVEYPPMDHGGANLTLVDGDEIWGVHQGIGQFIVPGSATINVRLYHPDEPDTGVLDIHAESIAIEGSLDAEGAGYTGGGGGGGGGGRFFPSGFPIPEHYGDVGIPGKGRYPGFDSNLEGSGSGGDGPFGGVNTTLPKLHRNGGYDVLAGNADKTTDTIVYMGGGGSGAVGGVGEPSFDCSIPAGGTGGGGGGAGGGAIRLFAIESLSLEGTILTRGTTGGDAGPGTTEGGYCNGCPNCKGGTGGPGGDGFGNEGSDGSYGFDRNIGPGLGAGGGVVLYCEKEDGLSLTGTVDARGGNEAMFNGGSIKIFFLGDAPTTDSLHAPRILLQDLSEPRADNGDQWILE